jgi:hypothetical protein
MTRSTEEERRRLKLLERLVDAPAEQRLATADELAKGDSELAFWLRRRAAHMAADAESAVGLAHGCGRRIGPGETHRLLHRGQRSTVYHAWDRACSREVALKLPETNEVGVELLDLEARTLTTMRHRLIVRMLHRGEHTENGARMPFLILEYVPPARNLADLINESDPPGRTASGRAELVRRLRIFIEICEAVEPSSMFMPRTSFIGTSNRRTSSSTKTIIRDSSTSGSRRIPACTPRKQRLQGSIWGRAPSST